MRKLIVVILASSFLMCSHAIVRGAMERRADEVAKIANDEKLNLSPAQRMILKDSAMDLREAEREMIEDEKKIEKIEKMAGVGKFVYIVIWIFGGLGLSVIILKIISKVIK